MRIIDISQTLGPNATVFPGDTPFSFDTTENRESGRVVRVSDLRGGAHVGTHVDFPAHFSEEHSQFQLETYFGPASVIDATDLEQICSVNLPPRHRVLLKTSGQQTDGFDPAYPALSASVVEWLTSQRVALVGVDSPSVDAADSQTLDNHHALLRANVAILENLDLSAAEPGDYTLSAFPIKTLAPDAAWVRAVLIQE
ncbi:MAG: cyclase family protein [Fimbriimonadales bacterium]